MARHQIFRLAIAFAGALTFFTIALASATPCPHGVCSKPADARAWEHAAHDGRALLSVSIYAKGKGGGPALRPDTFDPLTTEGRCWNSPLVKACVKGRVSNSQTGAQANQHAAPSVVRMVDTGHR